jgi:RNA polymerase sigma-70 factor (ECF subfamily)
MIDAALEARIRDAIDRGDIRDATTAAVRGYGPQIAGYLRAVLRSDDAAAEAFSLFCEFVWKGLPGFRQEASFLTWSYQLAWAAVRRISEDPYRRRARRLTTGEMEGLAAEVYSTSLERREQAKDRIAELRARLTPAEQTLLVLRVDRRLSWKEVALVLDEGDDGAAASALRKRFERLKEKIREIAEREGLLDREPPAR